jgi:hypothetical protein
VSHKPFVYTPRAAAQKPKTNGPKREVVDLRTIYRWGATLGLPLKQRGDVEAVSLAYRLYEDPTHPGFRLRNLPGRLSIDEDR